MRGRLLRLIAWLAAALALLSAGLCLLAYGLVATTPGLAAAVRIAALLSPARIEASGFAGSLRHGLSIGHLAVEAGKTRVEIEQLRAEPIGWAASPWRVDFDTLSAARVMVRVLPSGGPAQVPQAITPPVTIAAARLAVGGFELRRDADPQHAPTLELRSITAAAEVSPASIRVRDGRLSLYGNPASLDGTLDGRWPFGLQASATIGSQFEQRAVAATLHASGTLAAMQVEAVVEGGGAGGQVLAEIASFTTPALVRLKADLSGVDPSVWRRGAPRADLRVAADLQPEAATVRALRGSILVQNRAPGPVDDGRLPVRQLRATVSARLPDTGPWELDAGPLTAELTRGQASGRFEGRFDPRGAAQWQLAVNLRQADVSQLNRRLTAILVDGDVSVDRAGDRSHVRADLSARAPAAAALKADLVADPTEVRIDSARLALEGGELVAHGRWGRVGDQRLTLEGSARAFELGRLLRGVQARLGGTFSVDAALAPNPHGSARFELADTQLCLAPAPCRPVGGTGRIDLAADERLQIDAELRLRSAMLHAHGGLGRPDDHLDLELDVGELGDLGLGVDGALQARGRLAGSWRAPSVDAHAQAAGLRGFGIAIASVTADLTVGSPGADGALGAASLVASVADLKAAAADSRLAAIAVRSGSIEITGTPGDHAIDVHASLVDDGRFRLQARGAWREGGWRGEATQASLSVPALPVDAELQAALPLALAPHKWALGPGQLRVGGARFEDVSASGESERLAFSGRFSGLRPAGLATNLATGAPITDPLTLDGHWRLDLGTQAEGELLIERTAGDLALNPIAPQQRLGLRELTLGARLQAGRLNAEAKMDGDRSGRADATLQAEVERDDSGSWRLAQARPWQIDAHAQLPAIEAFNPLVSPRLRANLRVGGELTADLHVGATPGAPRAEGTIAGQHLRVAWIDQGVRLDGGVLRARFDNDTVNVDELRFDGPPRTHPGDRRAEDALGHAAAGFVAASGQLRLKDLSGVLQVQAQRMPLLQRSDRWLVATGGANIELSNRRVQLNGAVAADAGYLDLSKPDLPSLSSDVTLVEPEATGAAPGTALRAPQVAVGFDLSIDLGSAFFLHGNGIDARVTGPLRLRGEGRGAALRATGALSIEDGMYEGFGQRLTITRGRINFQGPPDNPGLDVLAVRTDLPVGVGVTVAGTASAPLIRLYSDPPLPDYEALSWLVFGRAPSDPRTDNLALATAAAGLLSGSGEGLPSRLAHQLGISEIALRSGDTAGGSVLLPRQSVAGRLRGDDTSTATPTAASQIISIGKRVNQALTISYEQAVSGTSNVVQLS
ncbi:MAG TPA: translocation/assembly module TamB domain-containing protein, partial [Burkholderiaceae bacterium]